MPKVKKLFTLLFLLILFCSCEAKIDTATDESFKKSIEYVRASLSPSDKEKFDRSLQIIAFSDLKLDDFITAGTLNDPNLILIKIKDKINDKTAQDIISQADSIIEKRKEKERTQALREIEDLEHKKLIAEDSRDKLLDFEVWKSRFYKKERGYGRQEPVIEMTVVNNTLYPISRAYFKGTLSSPGRAIPWLVNTFNHEISGGLEPEEEDTWYLTPNIFSDWGTVDAPGDAILTIEVLRLDGPKGEKLFSIMDFTNGDEKRLETLKSIYSE